MGTDNKANTITKPWYKQKTTWMAIAYAVATVVISVAKGEVSAADLTQAQDIAGYVIASLAFFHKEKNGE